MYTKLSGTDFEIEVIFLASLIQETVDLADIKVDEELLLQAQDLIVEILQGEYQNANGEERLRLPDRHSVKINFASSGQQEAVWILNVLFYYLLNNKSAYFIIEEPEAHLYPNIQKLIAEYIALAKSKSNQILVTTHSPYLLGTLNNLLYAGELSEKIDREELYKIVPSKCWLYADQFAAYYMDDGTPRSCMDTEGKQIESEVIDGASIRINEDYDKMVTLKYREE
ncbi:MAG: ATP-binding protein [Clostridiales bacterium]|nr:ATP-binding protein [Clostridiales bacterium]